MNPDECQLVLSRRAGEQLREYEGQADAADDPRRLLRWVLPMMRRGRPVSQERTGRGLVVTYRVRDDRRGRGATAVACYAEDRDGPVLTRRNPPGTRPKPVVFLTDFRPDPD